jgi:hypothetical protein
MLPRSVLMDARAWTTMNRRSNLERRRSVEEVRTNQKSAGIAVMAVAALALLGGCRVPAAIVGHVYRDRGYGPIPGGTSFHVLVYASSESIIAGEPASVNDLSTVAHLDGVFPGTSIDSCWAVDYLISSVPPGDYFVFAWIDLNGNGSFHSFDDPLGFYDADAIGTTAWEEPVSPNVAVPEAGYLDIDIWCGGPDT